MSKLLFSRRLVVYLIGILMARGASAAPTRNVEEWLKSHKPEEFTGQTWARVRIDAPANLRYAVIIDSETNPYAPARTSTGTVMASGLQQRPRTGDNDWGSPLPWIAPKNDADWLKAGQASRWVELPVSKGAQWHTAFAVRTKDVKRSKLLKLHLEFASKAEEAAIFHVLDEASDDSGMVSVKMPTQGGEAGMRMLEGFTEWARRRMELVKSLDLGPPPHLRKIKIASWATLGNYRTESGNASIERAELDTAIFEALGINSGAFTGASDAMLKDLFTKHHIIDTTITAWAGMYPYTAQAKEYEFRAGESAEQRWKRVFTDYYGRIGPATKATAPFAYSIATHINLGDEPGPATSAAEIKASPALLADFRSWLKNQGLEPAMLGAASWEQVEPADERAKLAAAGTVEYARLFYHTRRYADHYAIVFYRGATDAARINFPNAKFIGLNFQAGPMQFAFIGNDNDMDKGELDWFALGQEHAFQGIMTEDWTSGWDLGVGRIMLGDEMMRSAARKHGLPLSSYVVGPQIRARLFANLMHGVKEIQLYLYGPISNIGPAWSDDPAALRDAGESTRALKKFEDEIAAAEVRPAKVALLVAATTEVMQGKGLYCLPERQNVFAALQHANVPVEVVSEQEVLEGGLKNYTLLYMVDSNVRRDVQQKIASWVQDGGKLWACVGAANLDEYNQPCDVLDRAFGAKERSMTTQPKWLDFSSALFGPAVSKFAYTKLGDISADPGGGKASVAVWGAKLQCTPAGAKVVGTYEDGKPAVLQNAAGKGEATLVGALAGEAYVRQHYPTDVTIGPNWEFELGVDARRFVTDAVAKAGIQPPVILSVPGVYSSVMDGPNVTLVILNNATGKPLEKLSVRLRGGGKVKALKSTRSDAIVSRQEGEDVVFDAALKDTEIFCVYR